MKIEVYYIPSTVKLLPRISFPKSHGGFYQFWTVETSKDNTGYF